MALNVRHYPELHSLRSRRLTPTTASFISAAYATGSQQYVSPAIPGYSLFEMSEQASDSGSPAHASQNDNVRWNFTVEFCDPEDRPTYIGLTNTLLAPVVTIAPLIGAFLVTKLGYQPMFAVVAIISAIGGAMLLFWVAEPRRISTFDSGTNYGG